MVPCLHELCDGHTQDDLGHLEVAVGKKAAWVSEVEVVPLGMAAEDDSYAAERSAAPEKT